MASYSRMGSMEQEIKRRELISAVNERNWRAVVDKFRSLPFQEIQAAKMNKWEDTALHAAIISRASEKTVAQLIDAIMMSPDPIHTLSARSHNGNTPLHCAASRGSVLICQHILSVDKSLVGKRNSEGETPLFLSAMYGHLETFRYLFSVDIQNFLTYCRRLKDGDTILHCAIRRKYFDLSLEIIRLSSDVASFMNEKGESPLEILASTPSAFSSSTSLKWWESLCYPFIIWVDYKEPGHRTDRRGKDHTVDVGDSDEMDEIHQTSDAAFRFPSLIEKKKRHVRGRQIMQELLKKYFLSENSLENYLRMIDLAEVVDKGTMTRKPSKQLTALLRATKYGAVELVREILKQMPLAIDDETEEKKNIVLVAAEERQSTILTELKNQPLFWNEERLKYATDVNGNTALHLAAKLSPNNNMSMSVIHLQWEVLWFEYVMRLMPRNFIDQPNHNGKTPGMIFKESHSKLIEQSQTWVKDMIGDYIVAATLISGVTFATSYQIPGGYNDKDGTPIIKPHTRVFQMFAIAALVSFCSSITALAAFLAIYTSQNDRARHYRRSLPLKLCLGLSSLFVSIVSMLISFCAAHTYELDPRFKSTSIPLYVALTAIPLCFYTATQIPLYWRLLRASLSTVPLPRPSHDEDKEEEEELEKGTVDEAQRSDERKILEKLEGIIEKLEKEKEGKKEEEEGKKKQSTDHASSSFPPVNQVKLDFSPFAFPSP